MLLLRLHTPARALPLLMLAAAVAAGARSGHAQGADSVSVRPGERYAAGAFTRALLGSGYRDVWTAAMRVPVLDLGRFAGGLTPIREGGGRMTRTLHMQGADGRRWIFRSMDKNVAQALPPELQRTVVHHLFQDHISALLPTGALAVPPLVDAVGLLHVTPQLFVMPDDPRLGEYRAAFAGTVGMIEESPDEGEEGAPGFADSRRVVGTERVVERSEEDPAQRIDAAEYLAARLIDFVIGDTDRGSDQWRWAGIEVPGGGLLFRPVPRDRDFAFIRSDGRLSGIARMVYPKLVRFGPELPSTSALVFASSHRDRQFLTGLDRAQWDSVTASVQQALADDVIAAAVARLPPPHRELEGARLRAALAARRDALPAAAARFYEYLAGEVDVRATSAADTARIVVGNDGAVDVALTAGTGAPYFQRRFLPTETREVRVYLLEGADHAVVSGDTGRTGITLRVIGGAGDDELIDSTQPGAARVAFYDDEGSNIIRGNARTRIDRSTFVPRTADAGWAARRVARAGYRDWGSGGGIAPVVDLESGAGLILGARMTRTQRGFRRDPYAHRWWAEATYALGARGFGAGLGGSRTWEGSPWGAAVILSGEQYDAFRFTGFGNDTPLPPRRPADRHGLVMQDRVELAPSLSWQPSRAAEVTVGVRARYLAPRAEPGSPLELAGHYGAAAAGSTAGWVEGELETTGGDGRPTFTFGTAAFATPALWDAPGASAGVEAAARAHIPLGGDPALTLRGGGRKVWGSFAVQDAAYVGGRSTLRGYRGQRFAGDAAVYGGAEMHSPLARLRLIIRGELGAFAFVDAGRVFVAGASPGGWHSGYGAGLSFTSLGITARASWAYGEDHRVYLQLGSRQ